MAIMIELIRGFFKFELIELIWRIGLIRIIIQYVLIDGN